METSRRILRCVESHGEEDRSRMNRVDPPGPGAKWETRAEIGDYCNVERLNSTRPCWEPDEENIEVKMLLSFGDALAVYILRRAVGHGR